MDSQNPNADPVMPCAPKELNLMSPEEVLNCLERGELKPELLEKEMLRECVVIMRIRRYDHLRMARIIHKDKRTICRYMATARKKNLIWSTPELQAEYVGDAAKFLDNQSDRLIRLSYSDGLGPSEQARLITAASQIKKYRMDMLMDVGYLNRWNVRTGPSKVKPEDSKSASAAAGETLQPNKEVLEKLTGNLRQRDPQERKNDGKGVLAGDEALPIAAAKIKKQILDLLGIDEDCHSPEGDKSDKLSPAPPT